VATPPIAHLSDAIHIGLIQTPIDGSLIAHPEAPSRSTLKALQGSNFDQAPVERDGEILGYVLARDLEFGRGPVRSHMKPVLPHALASETLPVGNALPWLQASGFLFLLRGRDISGFVVPSDLNKQPGRTYFYLGIAELELRIAERVRRSSKAEDELLALLATPAAQRVRKRLRSNTQRNVEADLVAEMYFADLMAISAADEDLMSRLDIVDQTGWSACWEPINELRNAVAHPAKPILRERADLGRLCLVDENVRRLIDALDPLLDPTAVDS
jgi:hypothetical protein